MLRRTGCLKGLLFPIFFPESISGAHVLYMNLSLGKSPRKTHRLFWKAAKMCVFDALDVGALLHNNGSTLARMIPAELTSLPRNLCISRSLRCANVDSFLSPITRFAADALSFLFPWLSLQLAKLLRRLCR
jgi:hypothetical protein